MCTWPSAAAPAVAADQQREQTVAALVHQCAGGERQADPQQLPQPLPADRQNAAACGQRTQQRKRPPPEMTSCCTTSAHAPAPAMRTD